MSTRGDNRDEMTDVRAALIDANIDAAFEFLQAAFDDPSVFDDIPNGALLAMMPYGNPVVGAANVAVAERTAAEGRSAVLIPLGMPEFEVARLEASLAPGLTVRPLRHDVLVQPEGAVATLDYYRDADTLVIGFLPNRAQGGTTVALNAVALVTLDPMTREIVDVRVPDFLERAVERAPRLLRLLRAARLHDTTPRENASLVQEPARSPSEPPSIGAVLHEIMALTA